MIVGKNLCLFSKNIKLLLLSFLIENECSTDRLLQFSLYDYVNRKNDNDKIRKIIVNLNVILHYVSAS